MNNNSLNTYIKNAIKATRKYALNKYDFFSYKNTKGQLDWLLENDDIGKKIKRKAELVIELDKLVQSEKTNLESFLSEIGLKFNRYTGDMIEINNKRKFITSTNKKFIKVEDLISKTSIGLINAKSQDDIKIIVMDYIKQIDKLLESEGEYKIK